MSGFMYGLAVTVPRLIILLRRRFLFIKWLTGSPLFSMSSSPLATGGQASLQVLDLPLCRTGESMAAILTS
jgi:hypothetical protein